MTKRQADDLSGDRPSRGAAAQPNRSAPRDVPAQAFTWIFVFVAVAIAPPIASRIYAIDVLHPSDHTYLWAACAVLLLAGWLAPTLCRRRPWVSKLLLAFSALLVCELGARVVLRFGIGGWPQEKMSKLAAATYPDLAVFRGHPFLQFVGRPSYTLAGNRSLSATAAFNREGFHGPSVTRANKPEGVCRIVCLGASTTASGYPRRMRTWLDTQDQSERSFESVNLAHGFYTSAHSVVNFTLNALDYDPDYVVIHHGWNDGRARQNGAAFRGDYSHVFQPFAQPHYPDWLAIRASVLYRVARYLAGGGRESGQASLDAALLQPVIPELGEAIDDTTETFERNLRTIIDLAIARGIRPVLATIPHSTDPEAGFAAALPHLQRLTTSMRELARTYGDQVLFVDAAAVMSGQNALFKDLGHLVSAGIDQKAKLIGEAILLDLERRR